MSLLNIGPPRVPSCRVVAGIEDIVIERVRRAAIEVVIARHIDIWNGGPLRTARLYADALVSGAITPVTDMDDWERIPAALGHPSNDEYKKDGYCWTLDAGDWQTGIGSIHGLAHGVVSCEGMGPQHGEETDLRRPWCFYSEDLQGTGLTLDDLASAFAGDLLAAAPAFLRACAMPIP